MGCNLEHFNRTSTDSHIAQSHTADHENVISIYKDKGGDDFIRAKKALHVGSCLHFLPYHHQEDSTGATGVFSFESLDTVTSKQLEKTMLKYNTPYVTVYQPEDLLHKHELSVLAKHLPADCDLFPRYSQAVENFHEHSRMIEYCMLIKLIVTIIY